MYDLHLLVVDDEHAEHISRELEEQLERWIWVGSGLVTVKTPAKPLCSLQEWRSKFDEIRKLKGPCTTFTTIDLEIPEQRGGKADTRFGLELLRICRREPTVPHLVITKYAEEEIGRNLSKDYPGLHVVFNDPERRIRRLVFDQICHAVLEGMPWITLEEHPEMGDVIHFGGSPELKDAFLKAERLAPQVGRAPIVVIADDDSWGFPFVRLLGKLCNMEPRPVSLNKPYDAVTFIKDLKTWQTQGFLQKQREIVYLSGLEHWGQRLSEQQHKDLFHKLSNFIRERWRDAATNNSNVSALVIRFPPVHRGQLTTRVSPHVSELDESLCETMGAGGGPSHKMFGYPVSHPRIVIFPQLEIELESDFLSRVATDELRRRRLLLDNERLDYDDQVRKFLRWHRWQHDKQFPGIPGLESALDEAFGLLDDKEQTVLSSQHFPRFEKVICKCYLIGHIRETYEWLKDMADNGCDQKPGRAECDSCINTDPDCHVRRVIEIRERTRETVSKVEKAGVDLREDRVAERQFTALKKIDRFLDQILHDPGLDALRSYVADGRAGKADRQYPSAEKLGIPSIEFDWPLSNIQLHQCIAYYLQKSHLPLAISPRDRQLLNDRYQPPVQETPASTPDPVAKTVIPMTPVTAKPGDTAASPAPLKRESPMQKPERDQVFISYSHDDDEWLGKLHKCLKPFVRNRTVSFRDDTKIKGGAQWREEIQLAIASAKVAVLLVSVNFLASDFIAEYELPPLLAAAERGELTILWVALTASPVEETDIVKYQAAHGPAKPLAGLPRAKQEDALVQICKQIKAAMNP